jgi:putative phosphoribosyl transferase
MRTHFRDRSEAGEVLAEQLIVYVDRADVIVFGLPRGGVPVAAQVAKRLNAPLDIFAVRKLGVPGHTELAMGAIATGGVMVFNHEVTNGLQIPNEVVEQVTAQEVEELARREHLYRGNRPPPTVEGKTAIVVDDGIATGASMMAAISALRQLLAARIVAASPVIAQSTQDALRTVADEVVAVIAPAEFYGVGQWYDDFSQISDDEVRACLERATG